MEKLRWVSCARDASWTVSRKRHLIPARHGAVTTLCGATGIGVGVWVSNRTKPMCAVCISRTEQGPAKL